MALIYILAEKPQAVLERLALHGRKTISDPQFPYYLPEEISVVKDWHLMSEVASRNGDDVELIWLDTIEDVKKLFELIDKNVYFLPLTDGYSPFLGTPLIALLRSLGANVFGSGVVSSAASQNKYVQFALFRSLGIPTPDTWLQDIQEEPSNTKCRYIVKPIDFGNSIGIFDDGIECDWKHARIVAERINSCYKRKAIIQCYIDGMYCRASFIGNDVTSSNIGVHVFLGENDQHTSVQWLGFAEYFDKYKRRDALLNTDVTFLDLNSAKRDGHISTKACDALRMHLEKLLKSIDLAGIFTIDIVIQGDVPYFIEINTNPFLRNVALKAFCKERFGSDVMTALYESIIG